MAVYDKEDTDISNEELRRLTGINEEQEGAMDREATSGAAQDILAREQNAARGNVRRQIGGPKGSSRIIRGGFGVPKQPEADAGPGIMRGGFGTTLAKNKGEQTPDALLDTEDALGKGYTGGDKTKKKVRFQGLRKKAAVGGILAGGGIFGGLGLLNFGIGPLQFIARSEVLDKYHFGAQDDNDDHTAFSLLRYAYYAKKGQVEKTRLGFIGNQLADRFEARLNAAGLKSAYTPAFGFFDGLVIDRSHPEFRDMNDTQLKNYVKSKYGFDIQAGSEFKTNPQLNKTGTMVIDMRPKSMLSYFKNKKFFRTKMQQSGLNRVVGSIGANILRKRAGAKFHPVVVDKAKRKGEEGWMKFKERRKKNIKKGFTAPSTVAATKEDSTQQEKDEANANKQQADELITEGKKVEADEAAGNSNAKEEYKSKIKARLTAGGAAAAVVPCLLRGIAVDAGKIKDEQVVQPAIRMGTESVALGPQNKSGVDIDVEQAGYFDRYSTGKDSTGNQSNFSDATSYQIITGAPPSGVPPNATLKSLGKGTPFDFFNEDPWKTPLDIWCSPEVQTTLTIVSIAAGPIAGSIGFLAGELIGTPIEDLAAEWLAGDALDDAPVGADWGNTANFGAFLAANEQALASGGTPLSKEDTEILNQHTMSSAQAEFEEKNLAYRLFNPYDYRTPVAKFIDKQNPNNPVSNIASASNSALNVISSFGSTLMGVASGKTHAQSSAYYNFGDVAKVGMKPSELNDPSLNGNPYEFADKVATEVLEGSNSQKYIDLAKKCNAVEVAKDASNKWNATSLGQDQRVYLKTQSSSECKDNNDYEWKRVRSFINKTVAGNSLACFVGLKETCADAGVGAGAAGGGSSGGAITGSGDTKALAKQIDESPNITFQNKEKENYFKEVVDKGSQSACGNVPISAALLESILKASQTYKIVLGVFVAGHECDGGYHQKGMAVDINGVAKGDVSTGKFFHFKEMNAAQMALAKEFYEALGNAAPESGGGLGQIQCFRGPAPTKVAKVFYFQDGCDHLHFDVRNVKR